MTNNGERIFWCKTVRQDRNKYKDRKLSDLGLDLEGRLNCYHLYKAKDKNHPTRVVSFEKHLERDFMDIARR